MNATVRIINPTRGKVAAKSLCSLRYFCHSRLAMAGMQLRGPLKAWWHSIIFLGIYAFPALAQASNWRQEILDGHRQWTDGLAAFPYEETGGQLKVNLEMLQSNRLRELEDYNKAQREYQQTPREFYYERLRDAAASLQLTDAQIAISLAAIARQQHPG
jgi:hypothetical protein